MDQNHRVMLTAVTEAVLVAAGDLKLENWSHWEYLVDNLVWLHEELNDLKPTAGTPAK